MKIPDVTAGQYAVLTILNPTFMPGRQVREQLANGFGKKITLPSFYDLMSRLESAGLIEGEYQQRTVANQGIKERCYRITTSGVTVRNETRDFYLNAVSQIALLPGA